MVSISQGWSLFFKALSASGYGDLSKAAEWMYRLNVFSRNIERQSIKSQMYTLKNDFIRYLYQHGYCTEVTMQKQEFACWGTFRDGCTDDCPKCGGSGIYRTERLYNFRFLVRGVRYSWHQPAKLIDYDVALTDALSVTPFISGRRNEAILSMEDAWLGCCVVWWFLFFQGVKSDLVLWSATVDLVLKKAGILRTWKTIKSRIEYRAESIRAYFLQLKQSHGVHDARDVDEFPF